MIAAGTRRLLLLIGFVAIVASTCLLCIQCASQEDNGRLADIELPKLASQVRLHTLETPVPSVCLVFTVQDMDDQSLYGDMRVHMKAQGYAIEAESSRGRDEGREITGFVFGKNGVYATLRLFEVGSGTLGLLEFGSFFDKRWEWRSHRQFREHMGQIEPGWALSQVLLHCGAPNTSTRTGVHYEYRTRSLLGNGGRVYSCSITLDDATVTQIRFSQGSWDVMQ